MDYTQTLLNRAQRMFSFNNFPVTIDGDFVARELIVHGRVGITDRGTVDTFDNPHAWRGYCGGAVTEMYTGSRFIGASPVIGSCDFEIDKTGIVIYNTTEDRFAPFAQYNITKKRDKIIVHEPPDTLPVTALYQYIERTAQLLADIDISTRTLLQTCRALIIITAKDEQTKTAAEIVLKKIYGGDISCIMLSNLLDSIAISYAPTAANAANLLKEYKEQAQFHLAQFFHAIGINSNYNLKRERLTTTEIDADEQALLVNIADMKYCREKGIKEFNAMFNGGASVTLGDEWKRETKTETGANDNANDTKNVG